MHSRLFSFAVAGLASLAMASSANAAAVLSFGIGGSGTKAAVVNGSTTTLTTNSPLIPGAFPVNITTIGNVVLPPILTIAARETFTNVTSTGAATLANGTISQTFSGVISYLDATNPAINYLTITFTNAVLRGTAGGNTANLNGDNSVAGQVVTFTSTDPRVIPFLNDPVRQFDIGLTGLSSALAIVGGTVGPFTTVNESGNVSTLAVPEPASVVMASTAALVGLGCFGWRRSRAKSL